MIARRSLFVGTAAAFAVGLVAGPASGASRVSGASGATGAWGASGAGGASGDGAASGLVEVRIEGTGATVRLLAGPAADVLTHVLRRFSYDVAPLAAGDVVASPAGVSVAVLPDRLPAGSVGLFPAQALVVRDVLGECDGLVRWGGDDPVRCEGLFALTVPANDPRLAALAATLGRHRAGTVVDPLDPARLAAALAVQRQAG